MAKPKRSKKTSSKLKFTLPKFTFKNSKLIRTLLIVLAAFAAFVLIDLFVQYLNNGYSVAVVNGARIPKSEFYDRLEKAYGTQASNTLIDELLIEQEAVKQGYTVSESDIDTRVQEIEDQLGGKDALNESLDAYGITMDDLRRQVRLDLLTRDVLEPTLEYTEQDIKDFFAQYKDVIYANVEDVNYEEKKDEVEEYYIGQKVDEAKTDWLSQLRSDAKIQDNIADQPSYGFLKVTINIIRNLLGQTQAEN